MTERFPDIRITRGRYTTLIIPLTMKGTQWVVNNMYRPTFEVSITIQTEFLDELTIEFEKGDLIVEGSG